MTYTESQGKRLAARVNQARRSKGLTHQALSAVAQVSRPVLSRLINHGEVPSRQSTRDAIGAALGWEAGSCDAVLNGGEPTLCGSAQAAQIVAERLRAIAAEAQVAADESDRQAQRWRSIGENALAAALLALRGGHGM